MQHGTGKKTRKRGLAPALAGLLAAGMIFCGGAGVASAADLIIDSRAPLDLQHGEYQWSINGGNIGQFNTYDSITFAAKPNPVYDWYMRVNVAGVNLSGPASPNFKVTVKEDTVLTLNGGSTVNGSVTLSGREGDDPSPPPRFGSTAPAPVWQATSS